MTKATNASGRTCYGGPIQDGQVVLVAGSTLVEETLRTALEQLDTVRQTLVYLSIEELGGVQVDFRIDIKSVKKVKVQHGAIEITKIDFDLYLWVKFDGSLGHVARRLCEVFKRFKKAFEALRRECRRWLGDWICKHILVDVWPDDEPMPVLETKLPLTLGFVALDITAIGPDERLYKVIPKVRLLPPPGPLVLDAAEIASWLVRDLARRLPEPFHGVTEVAEKILEWMDRAAGQGRTMSERIRNEVLRRLVPQEPVDIYELLAIPLKGLPIYEVPNDSVPGIDSPQIKAKIVDVKADISQDNEVIACFKIQPWNSE